MAYIANCDFNLGSNTSFAELLQDAAPDTTMYNSNPGFGATNDGQSQPPNGYESWDSFFASNVDLSAFLGDASFNTEIATGIQLPENPFPEVEAQIFAPT